MVNGTPAAVPQQPRRSGRREREREGDGFAKDCRARVDRVNAAQHARAEGDPLERGAVARHAGLVLGAALGVLPDPARQPPPRALAQVGDVVAGKVAGHG